ncbi:MAG: SBBP repeat-containing protein, partial [Chloroflexota bacterium]|nr:SBBP repeat-containing protein [Chloroflexota bacterium]
YNRDYPLVIDPTIVFSTYLGGEDQDQGLAITVDAAGFVYVTGEAQSADFPTTPGVFQNSFGDGLSDAFVTKFAPDGTTLVYSTYLGGNLTDIAHDIYVDEAGNAYLAGMTTSANFPTTPGAFQTTPPGDTDAFVTKLNPAGSGLVYSTYLGGVGELGGDEAYSIAVDVQGNAYVTGVTGSRNFPVVNPFQADCRPAAPFCHDAFVSKLNPAGSALLFSTYLGGRSVFEEGQGIAVNAQGNAYVTGFTDSDDFPLHNPIKPSLIAGDTDAFVTEFSQDGSSLVYSTYLGGYNATDKGYGIALDSSDNIYVTGWTDSGDFPTANPYQATFAGNNDGFVTKLNPTGSAYLYSTYLGRFGTDIAYDIALDQANNMYVTGYTSSEDFPVANAVQPIYGGFYDAFVTAIDASGGPNLIYSTYLGGTSYEHGFGVAVGDGNTYVTGDVVSTDFPTTNPYQPQLGGDGSYTDAFVVKISSGAGGTPTPTLAVTGTVPATSVPSTTATRTSAPATGTAIATATAAGTSMPGMTATSQASSTATGVASTATPTTCVVSFTDVPSNHTFYQYVTCLACRGIVSGYNDSTFRPNNDITRGQIAKVISNAAGFNESPGAQIYEDVPASNAFYAWINRLSMRGIMGGYPCGTVPTEPCGASNRPYFRPNASATRGQLSKIVASTKGINTTPTGETYQDVATTHTFYVWIEQLSSLGVMSGYPCGTTPAEPCGASNKPYFRANNNVTRGQASKIVANTFFPNCQSPARR